MKPQIDMEWRGYRPFALLATLPEELARRSGLTFRESHDELDYLKESAFSSDAGTVFGLVSHDGSPVPGTEILAHRTDIRRGIAGLLQEALAALQVSPDDVRWRLSDEDVEMSSKVFVSHAAEDSRTAGLLADYLRKGLVRHGLEPVWVEPSREGEASLALLRDLIEECRSVVLVGSASSGTAFYELGVALALRKPVWRWAEGRFTRWDESSSVGASSNPPHDSDPSEAESAVEELIASLQEA